MLLKFLANPQEWGRSVLGHNTGFKHTSLKGYSNKVGGAPLGSTDLHSELWDTGVLLGLPQLLPPEVLLSVPSPPNTVFLTSLSTHTHYYPEHLFSPPAWSLLGAPHYYPVLGGWLNKTISTEKCSIVAATFPSSSHLFQNLRISYSPSVYLLNTSVWSTRPFATWPHPASP